MGKSPGFNAPFKQVANNGIANFAANGNPHSRLAFPDKYRDIEKCRPNLKIGLFKLTVMSVGLNPPHHCIIRLGLFSP